MSRRGGRARAPVVRGAGAAVAAAMLVAGAGPAAAQGPAGGGDAPWLVAGARASWEYEAESPGIGAFLRIPLYFRFIELVPSADLVFQGGGLTERQAAGDLAIFINRSTFLGAGGVLLNTIVPEEGVPTEDLPRETIEGYSLFFGVRAPPEAGRPSFQLELRWTFFNNLNDPRFIQMGVGWPLVRMPF